MKILIVNMFYYPNIVGGTENSIKLLAEELIKKGVEVCVYTLDGKDKKSYIYPEIINGVKVYRGYSNGIYNRRIKNIKKKRYLWKNAINSIVNLSSNKQIKSIINKELPDVIHTNNLVSISLWIWYYARLKKIPIVHTLRDYWLLDPTTVLGKSNFMLIKIFRFYTLFMTKLMDGVVTSPSRTTLDIFRKEKFFVDTESLIIPNAIRLNLSRLHKQVELKSKRESDEIIFLYVGSLSENKGIKILLKAISLIDRNVKFLFCGSGPLEEDIIIAQNNDMRINYLGKLDKENLMNYYEIADVLIVPSVWEEPFGRVIIEAAEFAVPTIASNVGGIPEIILQLNNGELVSPNDINELVSKIKYFCVRKNIKKYLYNIPPKIDYYSLENQVDSFYELYEKISSVLTLNK